jgi:hypothetical protein
MLQLSISLHTGSDREQVMVTSMILTLDSMLMEPVNIVATLKHNWKHSMAKKVQDSVFPHEVFYSLKDIVLLVIS